MAWPLLRRASPQVKKLSDGSTTTFKSLLLADDLIAYGAGDATEDDFNELIASLNKEVDDICGGSSRPMCDNDVTGVDYDLIEKNNDELTFEIEARYEFTSDFGGSGWFETYTFTYDTGPYVGRFPDYRTSN
ncbi:hypothetical protein [Gallaecimonas sp. GXIMD4217]|uniref:hypothetical protein n=1 Tax=Gallaecimonas sp. GXIMD4217 TaxID=3131927 RepID=UPI00311AF497